MTDAELSRAVADACGIEVKEIPGAEHGDVWLVVPNGDVFDPTKCHNDAFYAAEKCGLFDEHEADLRFVRKKWWCGRNGKFAVSNASGPRAICEAILAVTKKEDAK